MFKRFTIIVKKFKIYYMNKKIEKTNVMRILEQHKINYVPHEYNNIIVNGEEVARVLNKNENQVFKTLVTVGSNNNHYVFVVPVNKTLNLKLAAKSVNVKNIEMLKQKDLFNLTGYVHGGCSPIGMKKQFKTVVDVSALNFNTIIFSAGKVGFQVEVNPQDLKALINCEFYNIA